MAKRMFHESGDDGRSVMGMLAVQVERDPKTGATVVRSVAPTSAGAERVHTVFDDGRKSIHTVGGSGGQPSTEELGQILSVIDGVGMEALLDEVAVVPKMTEVKTENVEAPGIPQEKLCFSTSQAASKDDSVPLDRSYDLEAERSVAGGAVSVGSDAKDDIMALGDMGINDVDDQRLKEGPVTLLFLGYTDTTSGQDADQEGDEGMLTAERVMITEDGEEYVLGPETSAATPSESNKAAEWEEAREFQDVPLDGAGGGAKVQSGDSDRGLRKSPSPSKAEREGSSKPKRCQCCSVM
ncbi:paralemmin-1-like [Paralichthys olivaceus]|uniref:paralemmin-1-like n=1 Tax=Paralichthys olivaceus TaxID=8255 RepID=UPI00375237A5